MTFDLCCLGVYHDGHKKGDGHNTNGRGQKHVPDGYKVDYDSQFMTATNYDGHVTKYSVDLLVVVCDRRRLSALVCVQNCT